MTPTFVRIRYLAYENPEVLGALHSFASVLADDERIRGARFIPESKKREFLATRVLARIVLGELVGVAPGSLEFGTAGHGKPTLVHPLVPNLAFNLSNTEGLVAIAVTGATEVGIDVENHARPVEPLDLADRYFTVDEAQALRGLPATDQRDRFFDLWTLKEAYLKARGVGLSLPLHAFGFDPRPEVPTITFEPPIIDDPASWHFFRARPTPSHLLAVAVRRPGSSPTFTMLPFTPCDG